MIEQRLLAALVEIGRYGYETTDPELDAEAVARGLAYRLPGGGMELTRAGRREVGR